MKIKTKLQLIIIVNILILVGIVSVSLLWQKKANRQFKQEALVMELNQAIFERARLREEYFLYREDRSKEQFLLLHKQIGGLIDRMSGTFTGLEEKASLIKMMGFHNKIEGFFNQLVRLDQSAAVHTATTRELRERIISQMLVNADLLYREGLRLLNAANKKTVYQNNLAHLYSNIVFGLLALFIVTFAVIIIRSITYPLTRLHKGTEIIAEGNLDYKTNIRTPDEIGQLSTAFDRMTESLQKTTVSRDELSKEIGIRKQAEETLRASEERYRAVARLSSEFTYSCIHAGNDGYEVDWITDAFFTLTGYSEAELREQRSWLFISHPDDREMATKPLHELKAGESDTREFRIVTKGGRVLYIINYMECQADPKARGGLRLFGAVQEITERKRAEETLRESKEFIENLIASMQDGFSVLDSDGVQIDANAAFCQMTGFSREELIGVGPPHPYWPPEAYEEIEKGFQKTLRGEFSDIELTFMRKNGERFPVIVSPSWVKDKQGDVTSYFATVKDITERKRAEEEKHRLEERSLKVVEDIFRFIPEGVLVFSRKMELLRQNQAFRELVSGYARRLGFAEDELENLIIDKIKAGLGDKNIKEIRISRKHETGK